MSTVHVTEAHNEGGLALSTSPHLHSRLTTKQVMWYVVAALLPCVVSAALFFRPYQLVILAVAVAAAVGTEALIQRLLRKPVAVADGSAVITGLLDGMWIQQIGRWRRRTNQVITKVWFVIRRVRRRLVDIDQYTSRSTRRQG